MSLLRRKPSASYSEMTRVTSDRRRSCRYRVVIRDVLLGWKENDIFIELPASLEDLSLSGCLATTNHSRVPKAGESIWFKAPASEPGEWAQGIVVSVRKPLLRRCAIRIQFLIPLTYALFRLLVQGPDTARPDVDRPDFECDHFWK
jgi:hypothetical protein